MAPASPTRDPVARTPPFGAILPAMRPGFALLLFASLTGCPDLGKPVVEAPAGTISGTISYGRRTDRALVVEAWDALPAAGAPLSSVAIEGPQFPQAYTLTGVPSGATFLTARLADAEGAPAVLGSYPRVTEVSAVLLEPDVGLRDADFDLVDEGDRPLGAVVHGETRTMSGTVQFAGSVQPGDVLRGALYESYPPRGAPADFQILNVPAPAFPFAFRFSDVRDGGYYTVFYLDRRGDSPFGPGYEDIVAWAVGPDGRPVPATIALGAARSGVDVAIPAR